MRLFSVILLLLTSLAVAESQEDLYIRALKAEEAGDISFALKTFEEALAVPGPYTAEIQEIVDNYRDALGQSDEESLVDETESPWNFHTFGDIAFIGLFYRKGDFSTSEKGSELSSSVSLSLDYDSKNWLHSFEFNLSGDWFIDKDDMPSLDTSAWETSLGLEYSLIGNSLTFDIGANMNASEEDGLNPDFFIWAEKYIARFDKQKVGVALWGYENPDGPMSAALYASWHRYVKYGWKSSVYAGGRFEADSIWNPEFWLKWAGPSLKPSISYRFKTEISINAKMNLFYGFVVDGPDPDFDKVQKFSGSWGCSVSWVPKYFGLFVGVEQFYKYYVTPVGYEIPYSKKSLFTELKAGVKWDI